MADTRHTTRAKDTNPDPITGEPGSHPVGTGLGAAGGGATGAAVGTAVGGPIGGAVGAVVGAIAGGLAGKGVAEAVDPTAEDAYWREQHRNQAFAQKDTDYEAYAPAYRTGYEGFGRFNSGTRFEDAEPTLREHYEAAIHNHLGGATASQPPTPLQSTTSSSITTGTSTSNAGESLQRRSHLAWDEAKHAARAAWTRVERGEAVRVRPTP